NDDTVRRVSVSRTLLSVLPVVLVLGCTSATSPASTNSEDGGTRQPPDAASLDAGPVVTRILLPDGMPGIGFDDLRWAPSIHRILAPAGRTGNLDLVDPLTLSVDPIGGFSKSSTFTKGAHASGCTSADEGGSALYAIDHETTTVRVVDPKTRAITLSTTLAADPDYVRYVSGSQELWFTQPLTGIEVLSVPAGGAPTHAATIPVAGGPEAIVADEARGRVYTNSFGGKTYAVDIATRTVVETWTNGCALSLGLALDESRGLLFVACAAGSIVVLDAAHGGTKTGELTQGAGLDILSYDPGLHHLYVQGAGSGDLGIVGISPAGEPSLLGVVTTAASSTSATDEAGHVFVGDPENGGLVRVRDTYPVTE
ncbi:MAG TPA: hypothetical protein VF395_13995, partial [Polyangiaceae bacterium]